jgi:two-component system response regulator HydG
VPVVVITAFGNLETAIDAIRAGAYDFITKPFEIEALVLALERAVHHRALKSEVRRLRRVVEDAHGFGELLGESPAMKAVYDRLERIVDSDASVLLTGERGTGKELAARELHRRGRRSGGPFVAVHCAAMPEALLEQELFGRAEGAHKGLFRQASGGTLFLDEIADLPLPLQPKVLHVLQERTLSRVGSNLTVPFDARVMAASNRDLEAAVEDGRFREDLFFRINVVSVELPPLRTRGRDVLLLGQHLLDRLAATTGKPLAGFGQAATERLLSYGWPGNVRELQNCVEHAVAVATGARVELDDLPKRVRFYEPSHVVVASDDPAELLPMEEIERRYILRVMEAVGGNKARAARRLGLDRKTLYRKLERYGRHESGGNDE